MSHDEIPEFKDDKDIIIGTTTELWIEVKSRFYTFTCPNDIPFDLFKLTTVGSWNQLAEEPLGVALISRQTSGVVFAPTRFKDQWVKQTMWDKFRKFNETWYLAPRSCFFTYADLVKVLRARTR